MLKISVFILFMLLLSACGQTGGDAVSVATGPSPFPVVKANCGNTSCL